MPRVVVTIRTTAPPSRVWRALTEPAEVSAWDGAEPLDVPPGDPSAGQQARWRTALGPLRLTLHDRVVAVEPGRRLASVLDLGFVHVEEQYRLAAAAGGTLLVSDNEVSSRVPALGWLAVRLTRAAVAASMARLQRFCEGLDP